MADTHWSSKEILK